MSTSSLRCCLEKPERGWSEKPSRAMYGKGAEAALEARVLLANVSLAVEQGCCGYPPSGGRRLAPAS